MKTYHVALFALALAAATSPGALGLAVGGAAASNSPQLTTDYAFGALDYDTKKPIANATITVTYKDIGWGPTEGQAWSGTTRAGTTGTDGITRFECLDYGHMGLFDITTASSKFGPYAEAGLVIRSVACEAAGYRTLALVAGEKWDVRNDQLRAGGERGKGITFYLQKEASGTGNVTAPADPRGQISCWMEVGPNPAPVPCYYLVGYYILNGSAQSITVTSISDSGGNISINQTVPAGQVMLLYSASGQTYTPGTFHHSPIYVYTSAGRIQAPDYDFVVQ